MSKKVLVVDDDPGTLKLLQSVLASLDYICIAIKDPTQALKTIQNEMPDLVLLDVIMPQLDGYSLCKEIKSLYKNKIPVIIFTAQSYEKDLIEEAYKQFDADDYLTKPFDTQQFIQKIKNSL